MIEAVLALTTLSVLCFGKAGATVPTGLPLAFSGLGALWMFGGFPGSVFDTQMSVWMVGEVLELFVLVDFLQFLAHVWSHRTPLLRNAHRVHHVQVRPRAADAFRTDPLDAFVQLLAPLYVSLFAVRPCRAATSLFGVSYGLWLQWLHCDTPSALAHRSRWWVTPYAHHLHHVYPSKNYGHLLLIWDRAFGTCAL